MQYKQRKLSVPTIVKQPKKGFFGFGGPKTDYEACFKHERTTNAVLQKENSRLSNKYRIFYLEKQDLSQQLEANKKAYEKLSKGFNKLEKSTVPISKLTKLETQNKVKIDSLVEQIKLGTEKIANLEKQLVALESLKQQNAKLLQELESSKTTAEYQSSIIKAQAAKIVEQASIVEQKDSEIAALKDKLQAESGTTHTVTKDVVSESTTHNINGNILSSVVNAVSVRNLCNILNTLLTTSFNIINRIVQCTKNITNFNFKSCFLVSSVDVPSLNK